MERKFYLDILTVVSCFAVVMLHANGVFWSHPDGRLWWTSNAIETVFYFAVPAFFMMSGCTLMDYRARYDTRTFLGKRAGRTLVPFVFWSLFGFAYLSWRQGGWVDEAPLTILEKIINTQYISIYWFFIPLFAIYLSMPLFGLIETEKRKAIFSYLIIYAFISYSIFPFFGMLGFQFGDALKAPIVGGYLLYVLLGYYLDRVVLARRHRLMLYMLGLAGLGLHFFGTVYLSPPGGEINHLFKGYLNFPCVLYSAAIFVGFKYHDWSWLLKRQCLYNTVQIVKSCALGVYLLHIYWVWEIPQQFNIPVASIWFRTVGALVIFILCVLITLFLQRIAFVRRLIP